MILQTGGRASGATSTRSRSASRATRNASSTRTIPTCSPPGPMSRTSGTRMRSLMRVSVLMGPPRSSGVVGRPQAITATPCSTRRPRDGISPSRGPSRPVTGARVRRFRAKQAFRTRNPLEIGRVTGPYDLYDFSSATVGVGLHLSAPGDVSARSSTRPGRSSGTSLTLPNAIAESRGHPPGGRRHAERRKRRCRPRPGAFGPAGHGLAFRT